MADEDPRYQDGVAALKDDVEEAIRIFTELLEESVTKWGETALECAPLYYQYGNALILKVEDSDEGLFGSAVEDKAEEADAAEAGAAADAADDDDEDDDDDDDGDDDDDARKKNLRVITARCG